MNRFYSWLQASVVGLIVAIIAPSSFALVDMMRANFADSWVDLSLSGSGFEMKVERIYNSRSVFIGMFGFGWCSPFETQLERMPEGSVKLQECGAGQEIVFVPTKSDNAAVDKTVEAIVAHYKKSNPSASTEVIGDMRVKLRSSPGYRLGWAKQAGLPAPEIKKGTVFLAEGLEVEQMTFDGSQYTRNLPDGTSQKFDGGGRLAYLYDKNSNYLKFTWVAEGLKEIVDNSGRKLTFTLHTNKRVKDITGPNGIRAEYKFKGEDLTEVKNQWKNTYTYIYDDAHNLTRVNFPDNTFKALTYNQKLDWVTSYTDRAVNGPSCTESYTYEVDDKDPKNHFWSNAVKKCGKETTNQAKFEFFHKMRTDGRRFLYRVVSRSLNDTLDVTYHEEFGRPIAIKKNGVTTTYGYYPNGLIKEKSTAVAKLTFEYKNQFNKVSRVVTDFYDEKGKPLVDSNGKPRVRETSFTYDNKANLVAAANSDGQSVRLAYDTRGRISSMTDQAKKEVIIAYEERSGKPATITRPKVGAISVSYKTNGEINKVESKDGPTVAVQVASVFNNLLDIIAPATSELSM